MDIFISWSGPRSEAVAKALHGWLPKIINAFKPWLSSADIDKGARWGTDVAMRLQEAKAGIICVTSSNLHSDWILFEAGALSKTLQNTYVCPLLIGLQPTDIKGPLAQFQATRTTKEDVLRLLKTLNTALVDAALTDSHIEEAFEVWWPKLEGELKKLPSEDSATSPQRSDRDVLEEVLSLVRNQSRPVPPPVPAPPSPPPSSEEIAKSERTHEILKRILAVAKESDPELRAATIAQEHPTLVVDLRTPARWPGDRYRVILKDEIALEDVIDEVKFQLESQMKKPRNKS